MVFTIHFALSVQEYLNNNDSTPALHPPISQALKTCDFILFCFLDLNLHQSEGNIITSTRFKETRRLHLQGFVLRTLANAKNKKVHMLGPLYVSSRRGTSLEGTAWNSGKMDIIRNISDDTSYYLVRCLIITQEHMSNNYRMRHSHHAGQVTLEKESRRITKCLNLARRIISHQI